ncbi:glutathione S-transferase T3-like protein [Tanacetum coccineum]|uniref:Glutathione S-transferase T3-like protein n=1 Tax=Tanacetum coccineum TaxID=301880 RepID=A0ABQ5HZA7_9ASTR
MRMAQESGAGDEDYIQKAMIHYQAECGLPFKFRHCWEVLKDSPKFQKIASPNFNQGSQGSRKRQKSSGSSSFNTESEDASINLNNTVNDEDDVQEIQRPEGRDKAKNKGSKASGSSTMNDDALARLMVTELTAAEVAQREKFMELKRREVECHEQEIAAAEYRAQQENMSAPYALKEILEVAINSGDTTMLDCSTTTARPLDHHRSTAPPPPALPQPAPPPRSTTPPSQSTTTAPPPKFPYLLLAKYTSITKTTITA